MTPQRNNYEIETKLGIKQWCSIFLKREIYLMFFIYLFGLIPLTLLLVYISIKIDVFFGVSYFINTPWNILVFLLFFFWGVVIIWWSYTYLVLEGKGSPVPMLGQTKKLVKSGPYALVRHPSVVGKFFGVISLGFLFRSFSFTFIIVPVLFLGALLVRLWGEEKKSEEIWGEDYLEYKKATPMIFPNTMRLVQFLRKKI